jgi:hypothetical protein
MNKSNLLSQVLITEAAMQEDVKFSEAILTEALNVQESNFGKEQDGAELILSLMQDNLL